MTEIPEHLLARSKARRAAIGQTDAGSDAPAEAAAPSAAVEKAAAAAPAGPAAPAAATPAKAPAAPVAPPPPPPRPEVAAALNRKKIPFWAVPAVALLPGWAFLYAWTLDPREEESPAIAAGRSLYESSCASCHGADGNPSSGAFAPLAEGEVILTFPNYEDHVTWVVEGAGGAGPGGAYGDPARPGGQHNVNQFSGLMPAFGGSLSEIEILEIVRFEREVLAGHGCEPALAEATGEACAPGTEAETAAP